MFTGLLSPVLVLLLVAVISVHSSYISRGNGVCATSTSNATQNMFEYTELYFSTNGLTHNHCTGYCNTQTDPECIGYAYKKTPGLFTDKYQCNLYGLDGQGNFTSTFGPNITPTSSLRNVTYINAGSANTRTFYNGSGIGSGWTCYQKEFNASAIGDPHITSIYGCKVDIPLIVLRDDQRVVLMDCEYERLEITYRFSWDEHITRVDVYRGNGRKHEKFVWGALGNSQKTTVCDNEIEFHRYKLGINLRLLSTRNLEFTGLFADKSCLAR